MTTILSPKDPLSITCDKLRYLGNGQVTFNRYFTTGVGLIEINQPERHNSLSGKMMVEFRDIILDLEQRQQDDDLVALIVTGSRGKSFCAGIDLVFVREYMHGSMDNTETVNRLMHDTLTRLSRLPLITVASISGAAFGGGTELITAFDYICMDSSTILRFVQTRMGVSSPWGGARRLVARIGRKYALKVLAGAPTIDAAYGLEIGLVDKVVNAKKKDEAYNTCLDGCLELIEPFIYDQKTKERVSPAAVRGMKMLVSRSDDVHNDIDYEMLLFNSVVGSSKL
ncbi:ClpP/crotonase-like domain-containing protein [Halteromyces radiatus]|uniref:ClpP/crotonase-like domain-containing protein n=1 Tax=Halteromyces radiatus TaxID=101107 RepID=UPI00221EA4FC|nr:ClpP/crotonase-like domain-containing protein [Halteromyces radiatus]KAI8097742.1 ClpP/crotonase-like domain-containing protein [Halteromyces radiatus]